MRGGGGGGTSKCSPFRSALAYSAHPQAPLHQRRKRADLLAELGGSPEAAFLLVAAASSTVAAGLEASGRERVRALQSCDDVPLEPRMGLARQARDTAAAAPFLPLLRQPSGLRCTIRNEYVQATPTLKSAELPAHNNKPGYGGGGPALAPVIPCTPPGYGGCVHRPVSLEGAERRHTAGLGKRPKDAGCCVSFAARAYRRQTPWGLGRAWHAGFHFHASVSQMYLFFSSR